MPIDGLGEPAADQATGQLPDLHDRRDATRSRARAGRRSGRRRSATATSPNGYAGRVSSIAVDPSDPSGNTVYVAGASGGVWKTTNFLTTSPNGPTWIPLTDFGPTYATQHRLDRRLRPEQRPATSRSSSPPPARAIRPTASAADTMRGVGFLRSMDGGATWTLLDSTNNTLPYGLPRSHLRPDRPDAGPRRPASPAPTRSSSIRTPTPDGNVIIYAALGGLNGGLWRSVDTGNTWQKLSNDTIQGTIATDVVLDLQSATVDALNNPDGQRQHDLCRPSRAPARRSTAAPTGARPSTR